MVNIQKLIAFLFTSNGHIEFEIENTIPFTLVPPALQNEVLKYKSNNLNKICMRKTTKL